MKRKIFSGLLIFVSALGFGQSVVRDQDISLQNARILPAPTWLGGIVEGYFTMTAIEGVKYKAGEAPIEISVCFSRITEESVAAVTPVIEYDFLGDADFFEWKYSEDGCWKGYITKDIAPMSAAGISFPGLITGKRASIEDANARDGVGLYVKLTRQHSREPDDDLNDFTNNYTFTVDPLSKTPYIPELVIYPNINNGKFTVETILRTNDDFTVSIINTLGVVLKEDYHSGKVGLNKVSVNAGSIANGLYRVRITTKDGQDTKSVVIEK